MGVIKASPVSDMRMALREDDTTMLVTLVIILKIIYLSLTLKPEADPAEVYYFLLLIPDLLC